MNEAAGGQLPDYTGTISWAVKCMENGHRVCRPGWNGKGMWLAIKPVEAQANDGERVGMTQPYVYMKTAQGDFIPWLCSQADLLATDWEVVRD